MHSAIGLTPTEARDPFNEVEAYLDMQLTAKVNSEHPEINVGDTVYIYMKRKKTQQSHVSLWSDIAKTKFTTFPPRTG